MTDVTLPVDSLREAAPILRRPFTPAAVKFKPQSKNKDNTKTMCVAFIDARLVVERLNLVCPHLWSEQPEQVGAGLMRCHLTIDGVTHRDVGEGQGKALESDALKRAAVRFGVGVSLYAIPQMWIDGAPKFLSDVHQRELRKRYEKWLREVGVSAFGEPLDHGDVEGSQGDAEVDAVPSPAEPAANRNVKPAAPKRIADIRKGVESLGLESKLPLALAHVGAPTLDDLDADQAGKLDKWLEGKAATNE